MTWRRFFRLVPTRCGSNHAVTQILCRRHRDAVDVTAAIDFGRRAAHLVRLMIRVYGTSVALGGDGVLLRGPSGSGKSDLALRLIDEGARLVADDQTELRLIGGALRMSAPPTIAGKLEARGVGILDAPSVKSAALHLVVDLVPSAAVERLPEPQTCEFLGCRVPLLALSPLEASAPAKLRFVLRALRAQAPLSKTS
jgi:HPr kinase/phosphorylase